MCMAKQPTNKCRDLYIYTFEGYLFKLAGLVIAGSWCACTDFYIYYMKLKVKVENCCNYFSAFPFPGLSRGNCMYIHMNLVYLLLSQQ